MQYTIDPKTKIDFRPTIRNLRQEAGTIKTGQNIVVAAEKYVVLALDSTVNQYVEMSVANDLNGMSRPCALLDQSVNATTAAVATKVITGGEVLDEALVFKTGITRSTNLTGEPKGTTVEKCLNSYGIRIYSGDKSFV